VDVCGSGADGVIILDDVQMQMQMQMQAIYAGVGV
jgi:hypothetical protein